METGFRHNNGIVNEASFSKEEVLAFGKMNNGKLRLDSQLGKKVK